MTTVGYGDMFPTTGKLHHHNHCLLSPLSPHCHFDYNYDHYYDNYDDYDYEYGDEKGYDNDHDGDDTSLL